jgi:hypothetical protein
LQGENGDERRRGDATVVRPAGRAPDGAEGISGVQTLSRQYISAGGQDTEDDKYFNLSGVTYSTAAHIGTLNTNYLLLMCSSTP